jgi:HJR/Mrr/RecB family endonuclease
LILARTIVPMKELAQGSYDLVDAYVIHEINRKTQQQNSIFSAIVHFSKILRFIRSDKTHQSAINIENTIR